MLYTQNEKQYPIFNLFRVKYFQIFILMGVHEIIKHQTNEFIFTAFEKAK